MLMGWMLFGIYLNKAVVGGTAVGRFTCWWLAGKGFQFVTSSNF